MTVIPLKKNINYKKETTMNGKISNFAQVASLRRYRLEGGIGDGIEVLDCDNGTLRFLLNVSKACDVMQMYHEGQNVSFVSKNGFTKRMPPFASRFEGGMLYTCGLDNVGRREGKEMHGNFHSLPAEILRAECTEEGIVIEAVIRDTALFGQNLVMRRTITTGIGDSHLRITDTLCNESYREEGYCLLYHVNVGYPLLDEGAVIECDAEGYHACTDFAKELAATRLEISDAVPNQPECCYYHTLREPKVALVNKRLGKAFRLSYSGDTLPCFLEWKSMGSGDYALGLEPCTTRLDSTFAYRTLAAGERVVFTLDLSVEKL